MPENDTELTVESVKKQIGQSHQQLDNIKYWSASQAADFRAKAELVRELRNNGVELEIDELETVPAEPGTLDDLAEQLQRLHGRVNR